MSLTRSQLLSSIPKVSATENAPPKSHGTAPAPISTQVAGNGSASPVSCTRASNILALSSVQTPAPAIATDTKTDVTGTGKAGAAGLEPPTPAATIWTRKHRPPAHQKLGKTDSDMRDWIRMQVISNEKKAAKKAESTIQDYVRKVAKMDRIRDENGIIPFAAISCTQESFYPNRAALIFVSTFRAREALSGIDRADKRYRAAKDEGNAEEMARAKSDFEKSWRDLVIAGNDLARHPAGKAGQYVAAQSEYVAQKKEYKSAPKSLRDLVYEKPEPPPAGAWKTAVENKEVTPSKSHGFSKRHVVSHIQKLHPDWRDKTFKAVSGKWRTYAAVASITGCRPEEIEGIRFCLDAEDPTYLRFEISGAKTGQGHGIKLRIFSIREQNNTAFDFLMGASRAGPVTVAAPTMANGKELKNRAAAFRNAINQAGRTFIRQWKNAPTLSPYCFRHNFACDIKASNYSVKTLAIALGHSTTKTQQMYGRANDGVKGRRELKVDEPAYDIKVIMSSAIAVPTQGIIISPTKTAEPITLTVQHENLTATQVTDPIREHLVAAPTPLNRKLSDGDFNPAGY